MRRFDGFRDIRCVAPRADGGLYAIGKKGGSGTALWEIWPDGEAVLLVPASPSCADWLDVIDFGPTPGVAARYLATSALKPAGAVPTQFVEAGGRWDVVVLGARRLWAGGEQWVLFDAERTTRVVTENSSVCRVPAEAEFCVDADGITLLGFALAGPRLPPEVLPGGYVRAPVAGGTWKSFRFVRGEPSPVVVKEHALPEPGITVLSPATAGILVQWWPNQDNELPAYLLASDQTVTELAVEPHTEVLDALPSGTTLALRGRYGKNRALPSQVLVNGRAFQFTERRSVVGGRLAPDGLTAYLWTRSELIQIDVA